MRSVRRRTLLRTPAVGLAAVVGGAVLNTVLSACGEDAPVPQPPEPTDTGEGRFTYGDDPSQWGELYLPQGTPRGVVVVIHGGFWLAEYDYQYGAPLAAALADAGWAAWNLEYRRVGDGTGGGGGDPATFDDIDAGINKLRDLHLDLSTVVLLGHSAGGHLAAWAASRTRFAQWDGGLEPTHVIAQAGVLDLVSAYDDNLGGGAVENFLGHAPGAADAPLDPIRQVPLAVPIWCVHGGDDANVPISQSRDYVAAATAAGATAELVEVSGDHFALIDTSASAWARQLEIFDSIA